MTFSTEFWSWMSPSYVALGELPAVGQKAPSTPGVNIPAQDGKPIIITFLRHCGCPFAEKTFLKFRTLASTYPDIHFISVSHSDRESTDRWLASLPDPSKNTAANLQIVIDADRAIYSEWGLGISGFWHVLGSIPSVSKLAKEDGIKVRDTESGSRWQTAGNFAVDGKCLVRWSRKDQRADDIPDFEEGIKCLSAGTEELNH